MISNLSYIPSDKEPWQFLVINFLKTFPGPHHLQQLTSFHPFQKKKTNQPDLPEQPPFPFVTALMLLYPGGSIAPRAWAGASLIIIIFLPST